MSEQRTGEASPVDVANWKQCEALWDPESPKPQRCSLVLGHDGSHQVIRRSGRVTHIWPIVGARPRPETASHCPGCEDPSYWASRGCPGLVRPTAPHISERVPWCAKHSPDKPGNFAHCLACACWELSAALGEIDEMVDPHPANDGGPNSVTTWDVDCDPKGVVTRVKSALQRRESDQPNVKQMGMTLLRLRRENAALRKVAGAASALIEHFRGVRAGEPGRAEYRALLDALDALDATDCASAETSAEQPPFPAASYPGARPVPGDTQDRPVSLSSISEANAGTTSPGHQGSPDLVALSSADSSSAATDEGRALALIDRLAAYDTVSPRVVEIKRMLAETRAEEREACAKIVEAMADRYVITGGTHEVAETIRNRTTHPRVKP